MCSTVQMPTTANSPHYAFLIRYSLLASAIANSCKSLLCRDRYTSQRANHIIDRATTTKTKTKTRKNWWCFEKTIYINNNNNNDSSSSNHSKPGDRHIDERVNSVSAFKMFISVLVTFASTTIKIYLEFSENELFEKMKGFVAIVSTHNIHTVCLTFKYRFKFINCCICWLVFAQQLLAFKQVVFHFCVIEQMTASHIK